MEGIESVSSEYRCCFEQLSPNFAYGIVSRVTNTALRFFGFDETEIQCGIPHFKYVLKKKYREKCKSLHPDTADQKLTSHSHYKATGFQQTVKMYKRLENVKCLPVPLAQIDAYVRLDRFENPDMGFDINGWISRRKFFTW